MKESVYKLTKEGREYLENNLPEANLLKILKKPLPIKDVQSKVKNFSIALQWAKKRGWVKIDKGVLVALKTPEKLPEHEALGKVSRGEKIPNELMDTLITRKLVEKESMEVKKVKELMGKEVTSLTPELIKTGLWKEVKLKPYNVEAGGKRHYLGKRQPYNQFLFQVRQKLVELGFKEMTGPLIELEFWNFDALFQAQNHPSRDWAQTYTLKFPKQGTLPDKKTVDQVKSSHENGWKTGSSGWGYRWDPQKAAQLMPRAHTTACSARQLANGVDIPGKYFTIRRCFRPDVIDVTHGVEFNQTEGIVIDPSLTFKNLLGILKQFAMEIAGAEKIRFFSDYYPFTEPSVQLSAKHPEMGWIEFAGAGIFRPELTLPLGVKEPVIAWGIGIDRLAMFRLGINDIRNLFSKDLGWLRGTGVL